MFRKLLLIFCCALISCQSDSTKVFKIGVSQPLTNDAWRQTMLGEMQRQLIFHSDMEIVVMDARDNTSLQIEH